MTYSRWIILLFVGATSSVGAAEEFKGYVRVGGTGPRSTTYVINPNSAAKLCDNNPARTLAELGGMTVTVKGSWQNAKNVFTRCFAASDFSIVKTSSGKPAVIGILKKSRTGFFLDSGKEKVMFDDTIPAALKELEGRRVVIVLSKARQLDLNETPTEVTAFAPLPNDELDQ